MQNYVDLKAFSFIFVDNFDVFHDMLSCHKIQVMLDTLIREISLTYKRKCIVLDFELNRESILIVLASITSNVMTNHIFVYLIFSKGKGGGN